MKYRILGKTEYKISEISLGTWQVGGRWGSDFNDKNADQILQMAVDLGVNFIDTADVYEDGRSEMAVGRLIRSRSEKIYVATKCGRKINPHINEGYRPDVLRNYINESLKRLNLETIDLIQLHCPPTEVYYRPEIFETFEKLKNEGKIQHLGVSVEKIEEGIKAMQYENVATVQIIFNMFRQRPNELLFEEAKKRNVGVIVRVPLASGLLTGIYGPDTEFDHKDHRFFNITGAAFDKGETFAGIDFGTGIEAINEIKKIFPNLKNLSPVAIRWILSFTEVSCVIPGASLPSQVAINLQESDDIAISSQQMIEIKRIYDKYIKNGVHQRW